MCYFFLGSIFMSDLPQFNGEMLMKGLIPLIYLLVPGFVLPLPLLFET